MDRRLRQVKDLSTAAALAPLARAARFRRNPVVAVAGGPSHQPFVDAVREVWPRVQLTLIDPLATSAVRHVTLAAAGRFDAIWDLEADPERPGRVRELVFHLARGGVLVVVDALVDGTKDGPPQPALVQARAAVGVPALPSPPVDKPPTRIDDDARLAEALESITLVDRHLVLTAQPRGRAPLAKLREEEVRDYLARTGDAVGRVLVERPGSVVANPAPVRASDSDAAPTYRTRFTAPPLQLREYVRPVCRIGQVVATGHVLLPETYRHTFPRRLGNRFTVELAPRFARVKGPSTVEDVPGAWFHLDSEFRGHFGHAMTEQLSRLWAWQEAKQRHPDLKALLLVNRHRTEIYDWEYSIYGAAGVAPEDLVLFDGPVRPERLLGATPMFSQPRYVHAGIQEVYRRVGDHLAAGAPAQQYPERIFCSRRQEKRSARNTGEVEDFFVQHGFVVVYPEDYPMSEQVQMFRSATDLAGFGGSAMFTMAFVEEPKRVFLVSSETYTAQNEAMIAAVWGHQLNIAWCRPELTTPDGSPVPKKLQANFFFDLRREGEFLRRALDMPF